MELTSGTTTVPSLVTGVTTTALANSIHEEHNLSLPGTSIADSQRSFSGIPSASSSPVLSPQGKIFGRNINGTMVATSAPNNEAELQLYRVLQRASLLAYYDTLLEMGGDDVQQLCDAGEEEFLEIMALVGMASKPLHVRRLQKALHEWVTNPSLFQAPIPNSGYPEPTQLLYSPEQSTSRPKLPTTPVYNPTPLLSTAQIPPNSVPTSIASPLASGLSPQVTSSSPQLTPILTEAQVARIGSGAEKIARQLPQREPRVQSSKKRANRELEQVIAMGENDPRRMDEIRKYAAIYGRFDCKRRPEKPLTLHEVCVNEAAAQLCKLVPALLTRRDELFPLARQIVKDAGFGHSASIARFGLNPSPSGMKNDEGEPSNVKRQRLSSTDGPSADYKDPLEDSRYNLFAMYQKFARPSFDLSDMTKFSLAKSDYDDNDSRFSFSNSSTPPLPFIGPETDAVAREGCANGKEEVTAKTPECPLDNQEATPTSPLGCQVIAASGGHIIAVANPALAMSPALSEPLTVKLETISPANSRNE